LVSGFLAEDTRAEERGGSASIVAALSRMEESDCLPALDPARPTALRFAPDEPAKPYAVRANSMLLP